MSDTSVFNHKIVVEDGHSYYVFPAGYSLFKGFKGFKKVDDLTPRLRDDVPYFFGLTNMDPDYIKDYEEEYGIIFEYETTEELTLVAIDDPNTREHIYQSAPNHIQTILRENYGYQSGIRNSVADKDRVFANYLCSNLPTFQGYAIHTMDTDFGGTFHSELLICNANQRVRLVQRITTDQRAEVLIDHQKQKDMSEQLRQLRESKKKSKRQLSVFSDDDGEPFPKKRRTLFDSTPDSTPRSPTTQTTSLFGVDTPPRSPGPPPQNNPQNNLFTPGGGRSNPKRRQSNSKKSKKKRKLHTKSKSKSKSKSKHRK